MSAPFLEWYSVSWKLTGWGTRKALHLVLGIALDVRTWY